MSAGQKTMIRERHLERNRTYDEIRRGGAIGNLTDGVEITTHGIPTRLIACPGAGLAAAWPPLPNWTCTWRRSTTGMESSPAPVHRAWLKQLERSLTTKKARRNNFHCRASSVLVARSAGLELVPF